MATQTASARDRLLASADELFYSEGINNVGIDRVIEHAGVAKASLYSNFGSKDALVRSYLEARHETRKARVEARLAKHRAPRERVLSLFDGIVESAGQPGYKGCAFLRADAERAGGEGAKTVCGGARQWLRELFTTLAKEAGARNAPALAQQLALLYDGAAVSVQMDGDRQGATTARAMAAMLLDAAIAPRPALKSARKA